MLFVRFLDTVFGGFWGGVCEFFAGAGTEFNGKAKYNKVYYDLGDGVVMDSAYWSKTKARRRLAELRRHWTGKEATIWLITNDGGKQVV